MGYCLQVSPTRPAWCVLLLACFISTVAALELSSRLLSYVQEKYGNEARTRLEQWEQLTRMARHAPIDRKLQLVNSFFNRIPFVSDLEHWGQEDYWATPVELLVTNGGDCEDYSIAKYVTLRAMGVPDDQLRITYVKALELNQAHMVLAWYETPDSEPLILDNLINEIRPASRRPDLEPVYSFNGEGLWLNRMDGQSRLVGDPTRLSRWMDLNERLVDTLR